MRFVAKFGRTKNKILINVVYNIYNKTGTKNKDKKRFCNVITSKCDDDEKPQQQ